MIVIQIVFGVIGFTIQINPAEDIKVQSPVVVVDGALEKPTRPPTLSSVDSDSDESVKAEIDASLSTTVFDDLGKPDASVVKPANGKTKTHASEAISESSSPLLNESTPAWIRDGLSKEGNEHRFPIATSLHSDVEECRKELDSAMMSEVKDYLEKNVLLTGISADELAGLTPDYIKKKLLVPEREFENVVDRPSGSYHQLWRQIFISKSELAVIRGWEKNREVLKRTTEVGMMGGSALLGMTLLSGMVGLLARREKAKLKG